MNTFGQYIAWRVARGVAVVLFVLVLVFIATHLLGNPVNFVAPIDATRHQREVLSQSLGLDRPLLTQFWTYISGLARFNIGNSLWQQQPALRIAFSALGNTLVLLAVALALAFVVGGLLGTAAATRVGSRLDRAIGFVSVIWLSTPQFWAGLLMMIVFSVNLHWLPTSGIGGVRHLVLPSVSLALIPAGRLALVVRGTLIEQLNSEYIAMDHARGYRWHWRVRHAFRNIMTPYVTMFGYETVAALTGGVILTESVFAWPGIGLLTIQAVSNRDLVLIQAVAAILAVLVVAINLVVDVTNRLLDPRVGTAGARR